MALTERYLNTDLGTGLNDGTSEANAWQTWSAAVSGMADAQRLNIKAPASRTTVGATHTFAVKGASANPSAFRAYTSTPGDGGYAQYENLSLVFSGGSVLVEGLDLLNSNGSNNPILMSGLGSTVYNCKVVSDGGSSCIRCSVGGNIVNCYAERTISGTPTSATAAIRMTNGVCYSNIAVISGEGSGFAQACIRLESPAEHGASAFRNLCYVTPGTTGRMGTSGIGCMDHTNNSAMGFCVVNNTVYNAHIGIYVPDSGSAFTDGTCIWANNLVAGCPTSFMISANNGYQAAGLCIANAFDGNVSTGGTPFIGGRRLTVDPFTDKANLDFSLNSVAGGGLMCRASAASLNGTLDIGAIAS